MTRSLIILASSLLLGSGVAVPQGDPGRVTATFETASATVQAIPQNASPSRRGGWICDGGYVKRDRSCVTVAEATDAEVRQQMIARSIESYSGSCPCPDSATEPDDGVDARAPVVARAAPRHCATRDITDEAVAAYRERHAP